MYIYNHCNSINWDAWSAIGTIAAAFATFLTILLIRKQISASYKPELYINNFNPIYFYGGYDENKKHHLLFGNLEDYESYDEDERSIELEVFNLGLGAAIALKYNWRFDQKKSVKFINDADKNNLFSIELYSPLTGITSFGEKKYIGVAYDFKDHRINFVKQDSPIKIRVPSLYFELYVRFFVSTFEYYDSTPNKKTNDPTDLEKFPPLYLDMKYRDIAGKEYNKCFKFSLQFVHSSNPSKYDVIESFAEHNLDCIEV